MALATHVIGGLLGVASAAGTARVTRNVPAQHRPAFAAGGLTFAAAVYPLARKRWQADAAAAREVAGLLGFGAVSAVAGSRGARRLLAAAWASHALFDVFHDSGPDSRIPAWYPAACAGYDLAVAADLLGPIQHDERSSHSP